MSAQRPATVNGAIRAMVALIALSAVTTVMTIVFRGQLQDSWARGRPVDSTITPPTFAPVAVVLFIVFVLLAGVLMIFFREGHGWARLALGGLVVFLTVSTLAVLRTGLPLLFLVLAVLSLVLDLAVLYFLAHKETREYTRSASRTARSSR